MRSEVELNTAIFAVVLGVVSLLWWAGSMWSSPHWYDGGVPWLVLAWPLLVFGFYRIQRRAQPKNPPQTF